MLIPSGADSLQKNKKMKYLLAYSLLCFSALSACSSTPPDCGQQPQDTAVGNAGCMIVSEGRLLMVQQQFSGHWALPGGTAEAGERAVCTAARETREETGMQVLVEDQIMVFENGFHLYRCRMQTANETGPLDRVEISGYDWFDEAQRTEIPWRFEQQRDLVNRLAREQNQITE